MIIKKIYNWLNDFKTILGLSLRLQLGKWIWYVPLFVLVWPLVQAFPVLIGNPGTGFNESSAQNALIGFPLVILAIGLGVRIIATEVEQRTLEVTYTIPGGSKRVWASKLIAALIPLVLAEALLSIVTLIFFTEFPPAALYGAFQAAVFYLVLAMGAGALFKSEITAALVSSIILILNGFFTGFGNAPTSRWSPFFNPLNIEDTNASEVLAWTIQNRIGIALLIIAIAALSMARTERREQMLKV